MTLRSLPPALGLWVAMSCPHCRQAEIVDSYPDKFVGVGMELRSTQGGIEVVRTLPGGSAAQAGIKGGDRLVMIDGASLADKSLGDVVMMIRGLPNTQVTLALDRAGQRFIMVVKRRKMAKTDEGYSANP